MKKTPSRQSLLARVHVLAKSLGLDESRYRTILLCFTGQHSCRMLGIEKLQHLIAVLETMEYRNDPDNTVSAHCQQQLKSDPDEQLKIDPLFSGCIH